MPQITHFMYGTSSTYRADAFTSASATNVKEGQITAAIAAAVADGVQAVFVPQSMLPYNASLVTFNNSVQLIREGGDPIYFDVKAYGAAGNGVQDDTVAIQAAINAAISTSSAGYPVFIPSTAGTNYIISATLVVRGAQNVLIQGGSFSIGQNVDPVAIKWNGANLGNPLLIDRSRDCVFQDIGFLPGTGTIGIGIDCDQQTAASPITTNLTFRRIHIANPQTCGFRIAHSATALNSDLFIFENIQVLGTQGTNIGNGIQIENNQSKFHRFFGGSLAFLLNGIDTSLAGGSFQCYGLNFSWNTVDVNLGSPTDVITFHGCQSENAKRFIVQPFSWAIQPIVIFGNRLSMVGTHADGHFFACQGVGPFLIEGNQFADGLYTAGARLQFFNNTKVVVQSRANIYPNPTPFESVQLGAVISSAGDKYVDSGAATQQLTSATQLAGSTADTQYALTWGATPAINAGLANYFTLNATSNIAAVVAVPTGSPPAAGAGLSTFMSTYAISQEMTIAIRNSSGGALGTAPTFNTGAGGFKFAGGSIVNPGNGTQVLYRWRWDPVQSFWYLLSVSTAL